MDQNTYLGLMALSEGFGNLSNIGAGRPTQPSQVVPMLMKQRQEDAKRQQTMAALRAAGINVPGAPSAGGSPMPSGGLGAAPVSGAPQTGLGLPPGANPALLAAYGEMDPDGLLGTLVEAQLNPRQPPAAPAAIQEYQFAQKQGFSGTYEDFIRRKSELARAPQEPPASPIAALEARANAAGLAPGSEERRLFMLRGGAPVEAPKPADTFDQAGKLRDDFRAEPAFKVFSDVQDAAKRIGMFYQNPGAVSDYGLAVAFAKIVDPGSVAREGEVAAVQGSGALSQSMKQSLVNAINGEGALPPQMREEIVRLAEGFYKEQAEKYQQTYNEYRGRAERFGIDPRDALPDPLQSLSLRPVTPVDRLPDLLRGSPPTTLRHPDTGETIYWDGMKIAPVPQ